MDGFLSRNAFPFAQKKAHNAGALAAIALRVSCPACPSRSAARRNAPEFSQRRRSLLSSAWKPPRLTRNGGTQHAVLWHEVGAKPWEWPCFEDPRDECPFPPGCEGARRWHEDRARWPERFELYHQLVEAAAEQ